jgi:hypothetical protein
MILSIVMPTMHFRQHHLVRTVALYERLTPVPIEWIVELGHDNCGAAWNAGARKATGDILHMGADDVEPESDAWFPAALSVLDRGGVPLGWVREPSGAGTFGRDFPRVVICRREWWVDVVEAHYWSDNHFGDVMAATGHPAIVAEGFDFFHRRSMVGRDDSPERVERDRQTYMASQS